MALKIKYLSFYIALLSALLFSCQSKENKIEKALQNVTDRFPQLPKDEGKLINFYFLERTVIIGERNIELQLRSSPRNMNNDPQQIIIFKNPHDKYYAIPFFSNAYRDYWNFKFDNLEEGLKANTTFESEFNKAMDILNLHDTLGYSGNTQTIIDEMFKSLLVCQNIHLKDSIEMQMWASYFNPSLKIENLDSCRIRSKKNFEDIKQIMTQDEHIFFYCILLDWENNRIYQIPNLEEMLEHKPYKLKLTTYRHDCVSTRLIVM